MVLAALTSLAAMRAGLALEAQRSLATAVVSLAGLGVLALTARPLLSWRGALVPFMAVGAGLAFALPLSRSFLALSWPGGWP